MAFQAATQLGIDAYQTTAPASMSLAQSLDEADTVLYAAYRQVFGNAHITESERLTQLESQFKRGSMTVRELVRQMAKSDLYRNRFFDTCSRIRYTELTCNHLLGRALNDNAEQAYHSSILETAGREADIDAYIDSQEYEDAFGDDTVPFPRGFQTFNGKKMVSFTHSFKLMRGPAGSTKASVSGIRPRLNRLLIQEVPTSVVAPSGGSAGWSFQNSAGDARTMQGSRDQGKVYRIEVTGFRAKSKPGNRVSTFRRSNQVFMVPFSQLSSEYQRIHRQGGVIASITPVS